MSEFLSRALPVVGKTVHRLGLACNYGIDGDAFDAALDRGLSYIFWTNYGVGKVRPRLKAALSRNREGLVVAAGVMPVVFGGGVRRAAENTLKELGVDYLDIFQLFWVGALSAMTDGTTEALLKLKEEGKVRAVGISIHDRPRAGKLAADSPLDMLMIRYNAAHPGAERDIFPHKRTGHFITAYTATDWGKLLKKPSGWSGSPMRAADCYRFALSHPAVDVVLCGPKSRAELEENLKGLEAGELREEEREWMGKFGKVVHG
jgi:aryl-alcohol dehydrogenase-like predicted oxidoreductase